MPLTVREAEVGDARGMLRYAGALFAEEGLDLPVAPSEFQLTLDEEETVVDDHHSRPNAVFLLAIRDEEIVGMLNCHGSSRQALRHSCEMGISVAKGHRSQGVGQALLHAMVDWAKSAGIRRIELKVYARNGRAIDLYRSFGFEAEGRRRRAIHQDGEFLDDIVMSLLL